MGHPAGPGRIVAAGEYAARHENSAATERRRGRAEHAIDREVERVRARLQRITAERLDAETGSETDKALKALASEAEGTIGRLLAERAELVAESSEGLSDADAAALERFADEARAGLEAAQVSDRRQLFELLKLRGKVSLGENGIKLGREHCFEVEWSAVIELRNGDLEYKKTRLLFYTDAYQKWEAKWMPQARRPRT